jgi:hypothetical protein
LRDTASVLKPVTIDATESDLRATIGDQAPNNVQHFPRDKVFVAELPQKDIMLHGVVRTRKIKKNGSRGAFLFEISLDAIQHPLDTGIRGPTREIGKVTGIKELEVDKVRDQAHLEDLL